MAPTVGRGTGAGTRGWDLWIVSVMMVVLSGLFVTARMGQRTLKRNIGADDWIIIASLISSIILSITEIQAVNYGYGRHFKELSRDEAMTARQWFYGAQIAYKFVLTFNKMSICHMYYRIFMVSSRSFRTSCHIVQAFIVVSGIAFIIGTIFQCTPIAAFWDKSIQHPRCFNQTPWWISYAVLQIALDFVLLALPVRQVLKLQMINIEKFGLILVFTTGLFVTFTSIFRATTLAASAKSPDPTYGPVPATVWAVIEANCGIIAACLPLLRQPFVRMFGQVIRTTRDSNRNSAPPMVILSQHRLGSGRGFQPSQNTVEISQSDRDGEDPIIVKENNIHVMRDISVTSSLVRDSRSVEGGYCEPP